MQSEWFVTVSESPCMLKCNNKLVPIKLALKAIKFNCLTAFLYGKVNIRDLEFAEFWYV